MVHRSVPNLFDSDQPSPWKITFRIVLLMVVLLAAVWLVKGNMRVTGEGTQVNNEEKEVSKEKPS